MSATHRRFGASASKRRSTPSGAGRACESGRGVRGPRRRLTPAMPAERITRATRLRLHRRRRLPTVPRESEVRRTSPGCGRESPARAPSGSHRPAASRGRTLTPRIVAARGDTEHSGHRGDTERNLIRAHESVDPPGPVCRANRAVALRRSRRISSCSTVRGSSERLPTSRSPCATQVRMAWAEDLSSAAD